MMQMQWMRPTHKVSFYGVRCYFDSRTNQLCGVNWMCSLLIPVVVAIHNLLVSGSFPFRALEEYER